MRRAEAGIGPARGVGKAQGRGGPVPVPGRARPDQACATARPRRFLQASPRYSPSRAVPMSWSSSARIWAWADMMMMMTTKKAAAASRCGTPAGQAGGGSGSGSPASAGAAGDAGRKRPRPAARGGLGHGV